MTTRKLTARKRTIRLAIGRRLSGTRLWPASFHPSGRVGGLSRAVFAAGWSSPTRPSVDDLIGLDREPNPYEWRRRVHPTTELAVHDVPSRPPLNEAVLRVEERGRNRQECAVISPVDTGPIVCVIGTDAVGRYAYSRAEVVEVVLRIDEVQLPDRMHRHVDRE